MTQILNKPEDTVSQILNGVSFIHQEKLERVPQTGIIKYRHVTNQSVAIISGGGSGHEPAHFGYVGRGMLQASISGPVFVPPSVEDILQGIEEINAPKGTLLIIKNFEADVRNFLEAKKQARQKGYLVEHVIVNDDCSIEKGSYRKRRRGVAGTVFVHKILGAAAANGMNLNDLKELGEDVVASMNTLGVAVSSGRKIGSDERVFELEKDEISFGIGIHGEPGYRKEPFFSSEYLANELLNKLLVRYSEISSKQFAILINGLGSTTLMEQFVFSNDIKRLLELEQVNCVFQKSGNFMTSTDMSGISLTLLEIKDLSWLDYLKQETDAFAW